MDGILQRVPFVKAKHEDEDFSKVRIKREKPKSSESEGKEAKDFYESLVGKSDAQNKVWMSGGKTVEENTSSQSIGKRVRNNKRTSSVGVAADTSAETSQRGKSEKALKAAHIYDSEAHSIRTRAEVDLNARLRKGAADFLKCAQEGDLKLLKLHLKRRVGINVQDPYGWTAVMCATQAEHTEVLQFLLENGANIYLVDNQGQNALNIAESAKPRNKTICKMLRDFMDGKTDWRAVKKAEIPTFEKFYCDECKREFSDITKAKHETSTIHLFNSKSKTDRSTFYHLPENNKGFKLMVQSGWDREKGLGPEGTGHKFPVKTVLKRDRLGLGNPSETSAKITHFKPNDTDAVKRPKFNKESKKERNMRKATLSKRKQAKVLSKEKQKEMDFRIAFNTDF